MPSAYGVAAVALLAASQISALGPADSPQYANPDGSGYLPNHNLDESIIDSFSDPIRRYFNPDEKFFAAPLIYTPSGGEQVVFLASSQNYIRTLDIYTGDTITERRIADPFNATANGCEDFGNDVGVVGTPIIDPSTSQVYFFAKTTGGVYSFYAVAFDTLEDVDGYPILMDDAKNPLKVNGSNKDFQGSSSIQLSPLIQVNDTVYATFGSQCGPEQPLNSTATLVGFNVTSNELVLLLDLISVLKSDSAGDYYSAGKTLITDGQHVFTQVDHIVGNKSDESEDIFVSLF